MLAMVFGFVPFIIMIADAAFPETEAIIRTRGWLLYSSQHWEAFNLIFRWKDNISAEEQLERPSLPDLQPEVQVCPQSYLGRIRILRNSGSWNLPAEGTNPVDVDSKK